MVIGNLRAMVYVSDLKQSVDFYAKLGFKSKGYWNQAAGKVVMEFDAANPPQYTEVAAAGVEIGLHVAEEPVPDDHTTYLYAQVDDIDQFYAAVGQAGIKSSPPTKQPWGWRMIYLSDPDGYPWGFYSLE